MFLLILLTTLTLMQQLMQAHQISLCFSLLATIILMLLQPLCHRALLLVNNFKHYGWKVIWGIYYFLFMFFFHQLNLSGLSWKTVIPKNSRALITKALCHYRCSLQKCEKENVAPRFILYGPLSIYSMDFAGLRVPHEKWKVLAKKPDV